MDVVKPRCAGLDGHKKTVVACVRRPGQRGERCGEDNEGDGDDER